MKYVSLAFLITLIFAVQSLFAASVNSRCGSGMFLRKVPVANATELKSALKSAIAGDYILMKAGDYQGPFVIDGLHGSAKYRIFVCGEDGVKFSPTKANSGYGLWVKNSDWLKIANLEIAGFMKGVVFDTVSNSLLYNMNIHNLAQEGVHFRTHSFNNTLKNSEISYTGMTTAFFGEGVYIGSAEDNWCTYTNCTADLSNYNEVANNFIHNTGAESVDIKEGTSFSSIHNNVFEGSNMTGDYADSFIDVKGNDSSIANNEGHVGFTSAGKPYQLDAFQVHVVLAGNGARNSFQANTVFGKLAGYVVSIQSTAPSWLVGCDNVAMDGAKGISNKQCK